jgi:hypothetical protein
MTQLLNIFQLNVREVDFLLELTKNSILIDKIFDKY